MIDHRHVRQLIKSELANSGGALSWSELQDAVALQMPQASDRTGSDLLKQQVLACVPTAYLSRTDEFVRLPQSLRERSRSPRASDDDELVQRMRAQLQFHCQKFAQVENKTALLERYRIKTDSWAGHSNVDSAHVIKHLFHVASWATFAEDDLEQIVELMVYMLRARGRTVPTPRLQLALRHVQERLESLSEEYVWVRRALPEVDKALQSRGLANFGGDTCASNRGGHRSAAPGTHGRTDQALVRRTLGNRVLPMGCLIHWDGHPKRMRWYASVPGHKHLPGSNSTRKRFTDTDAIRNAHAAIMRWSSEHRTD